jgi:hypothetical protein
MKFEDATKEAFGDDPDLYRTPAAIVDVVRQGRASIFATERGKGFRLLVNNNGVFKASGDVIPGLGRLSMGACGGG